MTAESVPTSLPRNLFLIGYRGVGKSSVAHHVARALGWREIDADALLEAEAGQSIKEIFANEGEAGFRRRESAQLRVICTGSKQVVATGGGVVLDPANRELLAASGWCCWLRADADAIERRLQLDPASTERRPNLTVGGREEVEALLKLREPLYKACARASFDTSELDPQAVAAAIVTWLKG